MRAVLEFTVHVGGAIREFQESLGGIKMGRTSRWKQ